LRCGRVIDPDKRYDRPVSIITEGAGAAWWFPPHLGSRERSANMNDSTRRILRWCAGENRGMRINLAQLLSRGRLAGTGKLVIVPVDQGLEHGPGQLM